MSLTAHFLLWPAQCLSLQNLAKEFCICERRLNISLTIQSKITIQLVIALVQPSMQAMMQRTLSHSLAMSSGCKSAPSHHPTPPTSSAHTQTYNSTTKHCLSRQHLAVSAFTVRLTSRSSRRKFVIRADGDYGASWKDSQEAFLVLVSLFPCICS